MNKTSMLSALVLAVTVAASAGAQSTDRTDRPARPQGTEQDGGSFRRGRGGPDGMLLKGITLSADQQKQLADLRTREREAWQKDHPRTANGQNGTRVRAASLVTPPASLLVAPRWRSGSTHASPRCATSSRPISARSSTRTSPR